MDNSVKILIGIISYLVMLPVVTLHYLPGIYSLIELHLFVFLPAIAHFGLMRKAKTDGDVRKHAKHKIVYVAYSGAVVVLASYFLVTVFLGPLTPTSGIIYMFVPFFCFAIWMVVLAAASVYAARSVEVATPENIID